jgi:hypothetical protein
MFPCWSNGINIPKFATPKILDSMLRKGCPCKDGKFIHHDKEGDPSVILVKKIDFVFQSS